jgi:hypothetical protein
MMPKHNKKRNVGIIYELMLRHISNCLIDGDMNAVKKATKIIETRFNKNTELYKEFRLFNAIAKSHVKNTEIAAAILTEAKAAVKRFDNKKLDKEKSSLIRDINYKIKDPKFYYRSIPDYKEYASIQVMINEWRKGDKSNLRNLVEIEKKTIDWLLKEKNDVDIKEEKNRLEASDSNRLVVKIMTEKINDKYGSLLPEQKEIIKNYALYGEDDKTKDRLTEFLNTKKHEALSLVETFQQTNQNKYISGKIAPVLEKINELNPGDVSDNSIVKFLTITKLVSEIRAGE